MRHNRCRHVYFSLSDNHEQQLFQHASHFRAPMQSSQEVSGSRVIHSWISSARSSVRQQAQLESSSVVEEQLDPFSLVADDLLILTNRLRSMVVAEIPKLADAMEYFLKMGVEGKRFRPTILLLMARALNVPMARRPPDAVVDTLSMESRPSIAEIAEMIHVASRLHDGVMDGADTTRGIASLNFVMGNKLALLTGDLLLSRAYVEISSLKNTEVLSVMGAVVEHLVTGETMQVTATSDQRSSMEYYMQKTYYKRASLISNSCKAISILAGHTAEVSRLACEYGKNLGLAYQLINDVIDFMGTSTSPGKGSLSDIRRGIITAPILFSMEEFPELRAIIDQGFDDSANVDHALEYLGKSCGIERTRELAMKHARLALYAIDSFPENNDDDVRISRRGLVELTERVITR
ncbi:hypothetical protein BUALT_Bualt18G0127000 [Buddleja alternifolia]|uniref:Geranyl diphosphate synthase n=1 Tax=Buddleja alternifolia TaxID=168488 RepID=A0AAV6W518_9LAMI|nr:hypothetical protein BUALT_Bualt18G0127000 [Buddleja alternifolia]